MENKLCICYNNYIKESLYCTVLSYSSYETKMKILNSKGKGTGIAILMLLCVALLVAWLAVTQMKSLGFGSRDESQEDPVDAAEEAVDDLNDKMQHQYDEQEGE